MTNDIDAVTAKGGENRIQTTVGLSKGGMFLKVWAQPAVEDFMRSLGSGRHVDVQTIGRHWSPIERHDEMGKPLPAGQLLVYDLVTKLEPLTIGDRLVCRFDRPGQPLMEPPEEGSRYSLGRETETLNLSFLRCVGISDADGVSFHIRGVYTYPQLLTLSELIGQATSRFYRDYLRPFKLIVTVSTMPLIEGR